MYDDGDDPKRHDERLDPGESPLGPRVGDLGQEESRIPHDRHDLIPVGKQAGADSGVGGHLASFVWEGKLF